MALDEDAVARLRTACGHLHAVVRMAEDQDDCLGVLHQLSAVQGALTHTRKSILEHHLRECLPELLASTAPSKVIDEVLTAVFGGPVQDWRQPT